MENRKYRVEFAIDVDAVSVGEAVEMAREAVMLEYADVSVNGEEMEL